MIVSDDYDRNRLELVVGTAPVPFLLASDRRNIS
jgi:hypothetical protein